MQCLTLITPHFICMLLGVLIESLVAAYSRDSACLPPHSNITPV